MTHLQDILFMALLLVGTADAFQGTVVPPSASSRTSPLMAVKFGKNYVPKWKKKETLADVEGPKDFAEVGLKGSIPVVFQQGTERRTTVAMPNQPMREVAIQAGQFIKYSCGKGQCGTCECLVNGKWIRPCSTNMPAALEPGQDEYVIQVKEVKNKGRSSGKFYSAKSFVMGFYNNLIGMVGFVKYRRNAKQNWAERQEYEDLIRQKTLEKKRQREAAKNGENGNLLP